MTNATWAKQHLSKIAHCSLPYSTRWRSISEQVVCHAAFNESGTNRPGKRFISGPTKRKLTMFDLWRFGFDVQQVIATRVIGMMKGELSQREMRRMVVEKQTAYSNAQIAGAYALLTSGPVQAGREMIEVYERAVRANRIRLSGAPRSWDEAISWLASIRRFLSQPP
jgi:hypothetical protein